MIDAPHLDNERYMSLFDSLHIGEDTIPDGACRRCKKMSTPMREHIIGYPGGWHQFYCCDSCSAEITNAMDKAVQEARVHG